MSALDNVADGLLYAGTPSAPPASAEEGIRLVVPGVLNFNDVVTGENVYIKQP